MEMKNNKAQQFDEVFRECALKLRALWMQELFESGLDHAGGKIFSIHMIKKLSKPLEYSKLTKAKKAAFDEQVMTSFSPVVVHVIQSEATLRRVSAVMQKTIGQLRVWANRRHKGWPSAINFLKHIEEWLNPKPPPSVKERENAKRSSKSARKKVKKAIAAKSSTVPTRANSGGAKASKKLS